MKNLKNERGAVTLLVLVTILFFVTFLMTTYILISNKAKTEIEITAETRRIYETSEEEKEAIYNSYFGDNIIPIYTVEQLKQIGSNNKIQINEAGGRIYTFSDNATYVLMNDLDPGEAIELVFEEGGKIERNGHIIAGEKIMGDGKWNSIKEVNSPKLASGMTAVAWDKNNEEYPPKSESEWYNYETQKWANAKTEDGSYWVWIPRYSYKITSGTPSGTVEIKFLEGTTNKENGVEVSTLNYIVHPAFQDGTEKNFINGEWKREVTGIWVAKFEMGREDSSDGGTTWNQTTNTGNVLTVKTGLNQIRAVSKPRKK